MGWALLNCFKRESVNIAKERHRRLTSSSNQVGQITHHIRPVCMCHHLTNIHESNFAPISPVTLHWLGLYSILRTINLTVNFLARIAVLHLWAEICRKNYVSVFGWGKKKAFKSKSLSRGFVIPRPIHVVFFGLFFPWCFLTSPAQTGNRPVCHLCECVRLLCALL